MSKIITRLVETLKSNNTPQEIALGIGIGSFVGVIPLYGLHTIIIISLAFIIRKANKLAMLAASAIFMPPVIPFLIWAEYNIGRLILYGRYPAMDFATMKNLRWGDIGNIYLVILLGSAALGLAYSIIMYALSLYISTKIQKRREKKVDDGRD